MENHETQESVPTETALVVFRRYLMLEPQHVEALHTSSFFIIKSDQFL